MSDPADLELKPSLHCSHEILSAFSNFFWPWWVFIATCGLSLVAGSSGFSFCRAQVAGLWASVFAACGLEHRLKCGLSSCGAGASLPHGMWHLPGAGMEPVSLALAGGFLTTGSPGKP